MSAYEVTSAPPISNTWLGPGRQVERRAQVGDDILDRDRLCGRPHPRRTQHHRQALDERAQQLVRQASRAEDDRRAELDDRHAGGAQHVARLAPAAKVGGQALAGVAESAEVHDARHPAARAACAKCRAAALVLRLEVPPRAQRVHQVVRGVHAGEAPARGSRDRGSRRARPRWSRATRPARYSGRRARQRTRTPARSSTGSRRPPT